MSAPTRQHLRLRAEQADKVATQLTAEADRDRAKELVDLFDKEGGEYPPSYCLAVATLAAHAMARSSDPAVMRLALLMMIDRQFADAEFIRQSEEVGEAIAETEPSPAAVARNLSSTEPAGNA